MEIHIQNRKKGFTLAELLVVVAIVAILAAISIPIFTIRQAGDQPGGHGSCQCPFCICRGDGSGHD
ncbi:MAG: type IV pilin protein [Clostridium fessum]